MKPINFGKTDWGEDVIVDLEQEGIRFILLAGKTRSGKTFFHTRLYRQLMANHTPAELGFVFLDMTRLDFSDWEYPDYLARPVTVDREEALGVLETLADEERTIVVHIEECDMILDRARFEKGIEHILHENKNIYIVYSTSRIDDSYLVDWLKKYIDMKIVFRVADPLDSRFLLGSDIAFHFREPGEQILAYGDRQIPCLPIEEE
jgi:DNA segregation ATPase FtsK/SpoIIIE-like protein